MSTTQCGTCQSEITNGEECWEMATPVCPECWLAQFEEGSK